MDVIWCSVAVVRVKRCFILFHGVFMLFMSYVWCLFLPTGGSVCPGVAMTSFRPAVLRVVRWVAPRWTVIRISPRWMASTTRFCSKEASYSGVSPVKRKFLQLLGLNRNLKNRWSTGQRSWLKQQNWLKQCWFLRQNMDSSSLDAFFGCFQRLEFRFSVSNSGKFTWILRSSLTIQVGTSSDPITSNNLTKDETLYVWRLFLDCWVVWNFGHDFWAYNRNTQMAPTCQDGPLSQRLFC